MRVSLQWTGYLLNLAPEGILHFHVRQGATVYSVLLAAANRSDVLRQVLLSTGGRIRAEVLVIRGNGESLIGTASLEEAVAEEAETLTLILPMEAG